jgi:hypothetical protein
MTNRILNKRGVRFMVLFLFMLLLSCDNIFFPKTGQPISGTLRNTPQGIVQQLLLAYKNQRIDLYADLFSTNKDFRFYVSPSFASEYNNGKPDSKPLEVIDTMYEYVVQNGISSCNYWTYNEEIQIHTKLFSRASQITVDPAPNIFQIRYITNSNNDTTNAEVVIKDGTITILDEIVYDAENNRYADQYIINIDTQVFYLERDPNDNHLWVIQKWFDLGQSH